MALGTKSTEPENAVETDSRDGQTARGELQAAEDWTDRRNASVNGWMHY